MQYQKLYENYKTALKLRELSKDKNFLHLKEVFINKILSHISFNANEHIIIYLAGIKDVFAFVDDEAALLSHYTEELDKQST